MSKKIDTLLKEIAPKFFPAYTPIQINHGSCFNWALIAKILIGGKLCSFLPVESDDAYCFSHGFHACLMYAGKYFDAETLEGVEDWRDLPCFRGDRYMTTRLHPVLQTREKFVSYWKKHGLNKQLLSEAMESATLFKTGGDFFPLRSGGVNAIWR